MENAKNSIGKISAVPMISPPSSLVRFQSWSRISQWRKDDQRPRTMIRNNLHRKEMFFHSSIEFFSLFFFIRALQGEILFNWTLENRSLPAASRYRLDNFNLPVPVPDSSQSGTLRLEQPLLERNTSCSVGWLRQFWTSFLRWVSFTYAVVGINGSSSSSSSLLEMDDDE